MGADALSRFRGERHRHGNRHHGVLSDDGQPPGLRADQWSRAGCLWCRSTDLLVLQVPNRPAAALARMRGLHDGGFARQLRIFPAAEWRKANTLPGQMEDPLRFSDLLLAPSPLHAALWPWGPWPSAARPASRQRGRAGTGFLRAAGTASGAHSPHAQTRPYNDMAARKAQQNAHPLPRPTRSGPENGDVGQGPPLSPVQRMLVRSGGPAGRAGPIRCGYHSRG